MPRPGGEALDVASRGGETAPLAPVAGRKLGEKKERQGEKRRTSVHGIRPNDQAHVRVGAEDRDRGHDGQGDERRSDGAESVQPIRAGALDVDQDSPDIDGRARATERGIGGAGAGRGRLGGPARLPIRHAGRNQRIVHLLDHLERRVRASEGKETPQRWDGERQPLSHRPRRPWKRRPSFAALARHGALVNDSGDVP